MYFCCSGILIALAHTLIHIEAAPTAVDYCQMVFIASQISWCKRFERRAVLDLKSDHYKHTCILLTWTWWWCIAPAHPSWCPWPWSRQPWRRRWYQPEQNKIKQVFITKKRPMDQDINLENHRIVKLLTRCFTPKLRPFYFYNKWGIVMLGNLSWL